MKKKVLSITSLVLAMAMCLALVACGGSEAPASSAAPAESAAGSEAAAPADGDYTYDGPRMTIAGADSTGTMYAAAAAVATTFSNNINGLTISATTSSGSNENALNVHLGEVELGMCSGDAAYAALNGTGKFEGQEKFEDLRAVGAVYASMSNWITLASKGYTYLHDAKGGVFGIGPAASTSEASALLGLEVSGITAENSTLQNVTLGDGADNVANGTMDAATGFAGIPVGAQLNASVTKDCAWLGFTDEELDKILEANPSYYKTVIPAGTYNGQDEDVPTFGVKCMVICNETADEAVVYQMAKVLIEKAEEMIAGNGFFADMASTDFICQNLPISLHAGAEAYYTEAGLL